MRRTEAGDSISDHVSEFAWLGRKVRANERQGVGVPQEWLDRRVELDTWLKEHKSDWRSSLGDVSPEGDL